MRTKPAPVLAAVTCALAGALLAAAPAARADSDFELIANPLQADFDDVSEDLVAALGYKALEPAESTGIVGFSAGAIASYSPVSNEAAWRRLTGSDVDGIGMAGIQVVKGLPFNFDVGAFYSAVPSTDARLYGGELRWAVLPGGIATPAVAVRGSYTRLTGEDDLKMEVAAVDASVSKGFAFFTPYVGGGYSRGSVRADSRFLLDKAEVNQGKFFAGARFTLGIVQLTPEYLRSGDTDSYSLKLALGL